MNHPEYMQIARGILDDYGLIETLEEAHGLDEEEAEHDRDMIAREIRDAMAEARHDGAAVAFGLLGMAQAIHNGWVDGWGKWYRKHKDWCSSQTYDPCDCGAEK
jgi:hypothetical protein